MDPHAFAAYVKGMEYVITIGFVLVFVIFWQVMHHNREED